MKTKIMFAGLVLISVFTLVYTQVMVWNETTDWLSSQMVQVISEDNPSFLAQGQ